MDGWMFNCMHHTTRWWRNDPRLRVTSTQWWMSWHLFWNFNRHVVNHAYKDFLNETIDSIIIIKDDHHFSGPLPLFPNRNSYFGIFRKVPTSYFLTNHQLDDIRQSPLKGAPTRMGITQGGVELSGNKTRKFLGQRWSSPRREVSLLVLRWFHSGDHEIWKCILWFCVLGFWLFYYGFCFWHDWLLLFTIMKVLLLMCLMLLVWKFMVSYHLNW